MLTNPIIEALEKIKTDIANGVDSPSITIDTDTLRPVDEDDIAAAKYFFDSYED